MLLSKYVDQFIIELNARGILPSSQESIRLRLKAMIGLLHALDIHRAVDVCAEHIDSIFHHMQSIGLVSVTIEGRYRTLRQFFSWIYERGFLLSNPMRGFEMPVLKDVRLPQQPPSEEEVIRLLDAIPSKTVIDLRNRALTELLYSCGLRISEALDLRLENLNLEQRFVTFVGKGGHERQIPLMSGVYTALRQYLRLRSVLLRGPDEGFVFLSRRARRLDACTYRQWLAKHSKKVLVNRHLYPHLLRHSVAVHLLRGGADIRHVQAFLGHADLDTTKIYLRLYPAHLRADYDRAMPELV